MKNLFLFLFLLSMVSGCDLEPGVQYVSKEEMQAAIEKANLPKKLEQPDTAYVTAKSGLRVREKPSLNGNRIGVRPYGKKVLITHRKDSTFTIQDEGKEISGKWVGIETRLVNRGNVEIVTGYIFSGFLSDQQPVSDAVILANLSDQLLNKGIGGIVANSKARLRMPPSVVGSTTRIPYTSRDTVKFYKDDLETVHKFVTHQFLLTGIRTYLHPDSTDCLYNKNTITWSNELELGTFPIVKEMRDSFVLLGNYCGENAWVNLNELHAGFIKFKTYQEIFEDNPNGGAWEKGYTYKGRNKVLRAAPSLKAKAILNNISPEYEIHISGKVEDNWAQVIVKEAKPIFGEMYYKKSIYGKTWEGWIMITEPDGTPLIAPHVFGC